MTTLLLVATAIPVILAAIAGGMALVDASHAPNHRRPMRIIEATICYYFVIVYALAIAGSQVYVLKSGLLTRGGVSMLLLYLIAEIYLYRRHAK